jgi:hypothetical protein
MRSRARTTSQPKTSATVTRVNLGGIEAVRERGAVERAAAAVVLQEDAARVLVGRDAAGAGEDAGRAVGVGLGLVVLEPARGVPELRTQDGRDRRRAPEDRVALEEIDIAAVAAAGVEQDRAVLRRPAAALVRHAVRRERVEEDLGLHELDGRVIQRHRREAHRRSHPSRPL